MPQNPRRGPVCRALAAGFALLWVSACTGASVSDQGQQEPAASSAPARQDPSPQAATPQDRAPQNTTQPQDAIDPVAQPAPGAPPARLRIPDLDLDEELIDLGLADDGSMEVPQDPELAGWFTGAGRPGGYGPTVLVGHVDSDTGPAVFFRLTELRPGDTIDVERADGVVVTYEVTEVADYSKGDFPTPEVFGATARDSLRLITCTGPWDSLAASYEDNRVVYATPTARQPSPAAG